MGVVVLVFGREVTVGGFNFFSIVKSGCKQGPPGLLSEDGALNIHTFGPRPLLTKREGVRGSPVQIWPGSREMERAVYFFFPFFFLSNPQFGPGTTSPSLII
jgi:hypothetical protein